MVGNIRVACKEYGIHYLLSFMSTQPTKRVVSSRYKVTLNPSKLKTRQNFIYRSREETSDIKLPPRMLAVMVFFQVVYFYLNVQRLWLGREISAYKTVQGKSRVIFSFTRAEIPLVLVSLYNLQWHSEGRV